MCVFKMRHTPVVLKRNQETSAGCLDNPGVCAQQTARVCVCLCAKVNEQVPFQSYTAHLRGVRRRL